MPQQVIRAAILTPERTGRVRFHRDGILATGPNGRITFAGDWTDYQRLVPHPPPVSSVTGIICPPFLDAHIHIPQFPIRGKFAEGVEELADGGRLLAGLKRNVFPAESMLAEAGYAAECVRQFREDTLSQGVVGGAAYMTVHARATEIALDELASSWSVGMVLMNQNCPEYLRTSDLDAAAADIRRLAKRFDRRFIVTDRFAVAVDSDLRRLAARLAGEAGLRTQTHLNEQQSEKRFIERDLYPQYASYTEVYRRDGLLDHDAILAHCIWMRNDEWAVARDTGSVIAHCPTSNSLLGSGVIKLDQVRRHGIPYAICTDVGASPTTSILCEMAEFLRVHDGIATAEEALYRSTLAPAEILGLDSTLGSFEIGMPLSFIELEPSGPVTEASPEQVIRQHLLEIPDTDWPPHRDLRQRLSAGGLQAPKDMDTLAADVNATIAKLGRKVRRVVLDGQETWRRGDVG